MAKVSNSLLIIGGSLTGKTHYGGQMLGRLRQGQCQVKMREAAEDISLFEEVLSCLGQGITATHTPTDTYGNLTLPLEISGMGEIDLVWPDYGGEQIKHIMEDRKLSKKWRQRIINSNGWFFFLRLDHIKSFEDITSRPWTDIKNDNTKEEPTDVSWSSQAYFIELLQFFLHAKGVGTTNRIKLPAICIFLSCWDEIRGVKKGTRPEELLKGKMPLFTDYINSAWNKDYITIFGLSSLGKALKKNDPDEEFINKGPEGRGYVISPEGEKLSDLTLPIYTLVTMSK